MNKITRSLNYTLAVLIAFGLAGPRRGFAQSSNAVKPPAVGTWTPLANRAPDTFDNCVLLSDGTAMCDGYNNTHWYRLTPDAKGSYVNGTWTTLASSNYTHLISFSQVLRDGRLLVGGGEGGNGGPFSEIYQPTNNTWTLLTNPVTNWVDANSEVLPNGNVLTIPVSGPTPLIFDIVSNTWSPSPPALGGQDEPTWVKLPDDSILCIDFQPPGSLSTTAERYIPSLNQWIPDTPVPEQIWNLTAGETGPGFLLPNGKVIFFGALDRSVIYTPSGNLSPGKWAVGPAIPNGLGGDDSPAAMMANGKILLTLNPVSSQVNAPLDRPTYFYEYDYVTNAFTQVSSPIGGLTHPDPGFVQTMLDLPDGSVLWHTHSNQLYVYKPAGNQLEAGEPVIHSVTRNHDGSYHVTGTLFNGISQGAFFGDDYQMDTNRPIARLTNLFGNGHVYYARTYNWSDTGVMTGHKVVSTEMALPAGLPNGVYLLSIIANGISSDPSLESLFINF